MMRVNTPLSESIIAFIQNEIANIPSATNYAVKVDTVNKDTVDCTSLTYTGDNNPLSFKNVAVAKSKYLSVPIQEGDIGILLFVNTTFIDRVLNNDTAEKKHNYTYNPLFLPLGVDTYTEDNSVFEIYNILGDRSIAISDESIIIKDNGNSITIDDSGIEINDSNGNSFVMSSGSVKINNTLEITT